MELTRFDAAKRAIAKAGSFDELKGIRDKAEAARAYCKAAGESFEMTQRCAEIKVRAERRAGEMLAKLEKHSGDPCDTMSQRLSDIGVERHQSSRWQRVAEIPERAFEAFLAESIAARKEITSAGALRLAKASRKEDKKQRRAAIIDPESEVDLRQLDVAKAPGEISAGSISAIITDPPYPREFLPVYSDLSRFAAHALVDGGLLVCMVGQSYLPEIISRLAEHLRYHWTCCYLTPGGQAVQLWDRKVNTFWKPLLVFSKGDYAGEWFGDVCKSSPNDNDKEHHHWGQSESGMVDIVTRFTSRGDTVCDPFLGGGTTAVVCAGTGRHFIGFDIDSSCVESAKERLQ